MSKIHEKLFTLVVPAYNVEKYVTQCLDSLVTQTELAYQIILVNDGSTDNTGEICSRYALKYPELITYVSQDNKGLGAARNIGLQLVQSTYVGFLDSDDWLNHQYVEILYSELKKFPNENIDIIFTLPIQFNNVSRSYEPWSDTTLFLDIFYSGKRIINPEINRKIFDLEPTACRKIFRTDFLKSYRFSFPEGTYWEDVFPHFFLNYSASRCIGIKEIGFYYRINTIGQITNSTGKRRLEIVKVFAQTIAFGLENSWNQETMLSIIKMMLSFSRWSLAKSDKYTRKQLARHLHILYKNIPRHLLDTFFKTSYDRDLRLLAKIIRSPILYTIVADYLKTDCAVHLKNKMKRSFRNE